MLIWVCQVVLLKKETFCNMVDDAKRLHRVLHILYSSAPGAKGSDIRSRDLLESQRHLGLEVFAISSPFQIPEELGANLEKFNGVSYYRTYNDRQGFSISETKSSLWMRIKKLFSIRRFIEEVEEVSFNLKPSIVHAHSTFYCALSGYYVANKFKIPLVYEVRSLWEERAFLDNPSWRNRITTYFMRLLETLSMRLADHIVVISEGLYQDVCLRGISPKNVSIVPNGVNFLRVGKTQSQLGLKPIDQWLYGYVGSLSPIEGLDFLLEVIQELRLEGWDNEFHFFGDGPARKQLMESAEGLSGIYFHGSLPSSEVADVYKELDVIINPRTRSSLTDSVTPLKPLEAMAWEKLIIASNVGGMCELIEDGITGILFEADNKASLKEVIQNLESDKAFCIAKRGKSHVMENRSWSKNAFKYQQIYDNFLDFS